MNLHLMPENLALSVAPLRNSRIITCNICLDGKIFRQNLLRSELINASLAKYWNNFSALPNGRII